MDNFIQWKGTDVCMDFYCDCGHHNHYDGYFAYYVECEGCKQIFELDTKIIMKKNNNPICEPLKSI